MAAERRFPAMGTTVHVVVVPGGPGDGAGLLDAAEARLDDLERRWSRFLPDSEVSRCNDAAGHAVEVSPETQLLVARAVAGWERTAGRFDPTVLPALVAAGYDETFAAVAARTDDRGRLGPATATPGCEGIAIDRAAGTVALPPGVAFDPGGIGKGLAADLVAAELTARGARGVCVNLGGDLRVDGDGPDGHGWVVALEHPLGAPDTTGTPVLAPPRVDSAPASRPSGQACALSPAPRVDSAPASRPSGQACALSPVHLRRGAVASTWRTRRAWGPARDRRHHVIDPDDGRPAATGIAGVVVLAHAGWWAEVLALAAFLSGRDGVALLDAHGVAGLSVADDGTVRSAGPIEEFRPWSR